MDGFSSWKLKYSRDFFAHELVVLTFKPFAMADRSIQQHGRRGRKEAPPFTPEAADLLHVPLGLY